MQTLNVLLLNVATHGLHVIFTIRISCCLLMSCVSRVNKSCKIDEILLHCRVSTCYC